MRSEEMHPDTGEHRRVRFLDPVPHSPLWCWTISEPPGEPVVIHQLKSRHRPEGSETFHVSPRFYLMPDVVTPDGLMSEFKTSRFWHAPAALVIGHYLPEVNSFRGKGRRAWRRFLRKGARPMYGAPVTIRLPERIVEKIREIHDDRGNQNREDPATG